MKKFKTLTLVALVAVITVFWAIGCTGGGIFDPNVSPVPTSSSASGSPSGAPTDIFAPGKTIHQFVPKNTNVFNLMVWGNSSAEPYKHVFLKDGIEWYDWAEDVYWVEQSSNPAGRYYRKRFERKPTTVQNTKTLVTGLNLPQAFILERKPDPSPLPTPDPEKVQDFMITAEPENPSGGVIKQYTLNKDGVITTETKSLSSAIQGQVPYMILLDSYVYYVRSVGGSSSAVERVPAFPTQGNYPATPEPVAQDLTNAHHIYAHQPWIPDGAKDPTTKLEVKLPDALKSFVFVTEQVAAPSGRVLLFNVSEWDGKSVLNPTVIADSQQQPSKVTFIPDLQKYLIVNEDGTEEYAYGNKIKPTGYLYWINYDLSSGQLMRVQLITNNEGPGQEGTNLIVKGSPEIVAKSLLASYDIIGPDNFRDIFFQDNGDGTYSIVSKNKYDTWQVYADKKSHFFQTVYVSSNLSQVNNGNWYAIDTAQFKTNNPLQPGKPGVTQFTKESVPYPFNGVMQTYYVVTGTDNYGRACKLDLFFCGYNFATDGNEDGVVYVQEYNFKTEF